MPAGMQIWDAAGNLLSDTTTLVLRELVPFEVTSTDTATHSVPIPIDAGTTTVVQNDSNGVPGDNSGEFVTTSIDHAEGEIVYKFTTADRAARIRALQF
ncbi:MAG: hypothetical protein V4808_07245 [Pseudomonadota bacterium]